MATVILNPLGHATNLVLNSDRFDPVKWWNGLTEGERIGYCIAAAASLVFVIVWIVGLALMGRQNNKAAFFVLTACFMFIPGLQLPAFIMACVGINTLREGGNIEDLV